LVTKNHMEKREMKTLKGWLTGGILAAMLLFASVPAKADGIIFGSAGDTPTCNNNSGIIFGTTGIIFGSTGIIFGGTGIIFGAADTTGDNTNGCTAG
jgi:hypothetical protein